MTVKLLIDPGHTGVSDPGAVAGGLREADVNLDVALRLRDKLAGVPGLQLRMTRDKHGDLTKPFTQVADLTARSNMANSWPADLFLSIHANAAGNVNAHGYETFVHHNASPESVRVGQILHHHLAPLFRADRGLKTADFHVLRETRMPAVLVEMGFVTNTEDRAMLQDSAFRERLAESLFTAILAAYPSLSHANTPIIGEPVATLGQAREWLKERAPNWVHLADLYWQIAPCYGVRPDVALCQAVKETGNFAYTGIVKPDQNNFCGLAATGTANGPDVPLRGADPSAVKMEPGRHGATFATPEIGVEAHVQHLYAYATTDPLPAWATLYSPRFALVNRGSAPVVEHLGAAENPTGQGWAYPGADYGKSIVRDYLASLLATAEPMPPAGDAERIRELERQLTLAQAEAAAAKAELQRITEGIKELVKM